jgi:hypothetical protein
MGCRQDGCIRARGLSPSSPPDEPPTRAVPPAMPPLHLPSPTRRRASPRDPARAGHDSGDGPRRLDPSPHSDASPGRTQVQAEMPTGRLARSGGGSTVPGGRQRLQPYRSVPATTIAGGAPGRRSQDTLGRRLAANAAIGRAGSPVPASGRLPGQPPSRRGPPGGYDDPNSWAARSPARSARRRW